MKYIILISIFGAQIVFAHQDKANFGNGNNINNCNPVLRCSPRVVYRTKIDNSRIVELEAQIVALQAKYDQALYFVHHRPKQVVQVVKQEESRSNSLSLLGAVSQTKLKTSEDATSYKSKTEAEFDAGLMFQHDFGMIRGSIAATLNGTGILGVGLNF